eukprot:1886042-Pyramimonas_sp.AAC.1
MGGEQKARVHAKVGQGLEQRLIGLYYHILTIGVTGATWLGMHYSNSVGPKLSPLGSLEVGGQLMRQISSP